MSPVRGVNQWKPRHLQKTRQDNFDWFCRRKLAIACGWDPVINDVLSWNHYDRNKTSAEDDLDLEDGVYRPYFLHNCYLATDATESARANMTYGQQRPSNRARTAVRAFAWVLAPYRFDFVKMLGFGGGGVATLFQYESVTPATALLRAVTMRNPPPPTRRPDGRGRPRKIRPRDAKKKTKWTYGGYLLQEQFEHVDMDLRRLVMRCMMDDPADRPEMEEIGAMIEAKLASEEEEDADEDQAMHDELSNEIVKGPPPPHHWDKVELEEWLAGRYEVVV
ncbi:hypothetical protein B0H66DRAFT_598995 [Apodospora peruviana]|uniref:Uncharacterized protein n=1 Tax=Apodospora peruviana TaxID=516989 RepID=A0AAE0IUQ9_9PEZI|nr:hypothetical protein B0H66DRAFT_598995 [Apodospora peruviana]